jgi:uncharacterized membrane protein YfcA
VIPLILLTGIVAGGLASVVGFGIGSLLTPAFSLSVDTKLAVAAVAIPHVIGTAQRMWRLRHHVDRSLLVRFGLPSAAGGLAGAFLLQSISSRVATAVFAGLLLFVGIGEWTGRLARLRFHRSVAYLAGGLSGLLGGLVGNQGGIRSAALLGFKTSKERFVATATAVGLIVDGARLPIYLAHEHGRLLPMWPTIAAATAGVVIGTAIGGPLLSRLPESAFRRVVAATLVGLGVVMLLRAWWPE